jgi:hypothetical protein
MVTVGTGGALVSSDGWVGFSISGSGALYGGGYAGGIDRMYDVHIDGEVRIQDFTDKSGDDSRVYDRVAVNGDNITIRTLEQPFVNSHWGHWLDPPWTIELRTDDPDGISISNPVREVVLLLADWVVTALVAIVIWFRPWAGTVKQAERVVEGYDSPKPAPEVVLYEQPQPQRPGGVRAGRAVLGGVDMHPERHRMSSHSPGLGTPLGGLTCFCIVVCVVNPIIGLVGGAFAVLRYNYPMALLGAVFTMVSPGYIVVPWACIPFPFVGMLALALIMSGRRSFRRLPPFGPPGDKAPNED